MTHLSLVLLAWVTSVALRQATGSATVATATTAGILAPLVTEISVVRMHAGTKKPSPQKSPESRSNELIAG
jgi:H+/gluconate symporter-like permease